MLNYLKYYELENVKNLKALEDEVVKRLLDGELKFFKWIVPGMASTDYHYRSANCRPAIKIRVDHASVGGTFSFIWIGGEDLSFKVKSEFDYERVITAITRGIDEASPDLGIMRLWKC